MANIQRITRTVIRITCPPFGPYSPQPTQTYLIGSKRNRILIDAGTGHPEYLQALAHVLKQESAVLSNVLLTHSHANHSNGAALLEKILHEHIPGQRQTPQIRKAFTANEFISDKEGDIRIQAIATPGHDPHHVSFFFPEEDALFSGDAIESHPDSSGRRPPLLRALFQDLPTYLNSLKRIRATFPKMIYGAHNEEVVLDTLTYVDNAVKTQEMLKSTILEILSKASPLTTKEVVDLVSKQLLRDTSSRQHHAFLLHGLVRQHLDLLAQQKQILRRSLAHDPTRVSGMDPSKIKGPGGLTMQQIFSKVQETRRRDWDMYNKNETGIAKDDMSRKLAMSRLLSQLHPLHQHCTTIHEHDSWVRI